MFYVRLRSTVDPVATAVPCEGCPQVPDIHIHISSGSVSDADPASVLRQLSAGTI
jgi:hypothetical protein